MVRGGVSATKAGSVGRERRRAAAGGEAWADEGAHVDRLHSLDKVRMTRQLPQPPTPHRDMDNRNFELCELKFRDVTWDLTRLPHHIPYFKVSLENRKGWIRKTCSKSEYEADGALEGMADG